MSLPCSLQISQVLQGVENIIQCEVTPPGFAARSLGAALVTGDGLNIASADWRNNLLSQLN